MTEREITGKTIEFKKPHFGMLNEINKLIMKKDTLEYRMMQERNRLKVPDSKLLTGSLTGKFPVILDGGRTIIYISDKSLESETRKNYELRLSNKFMVFAKKQKV